MEYSYKVVCPVKAGPEFNPQKAAGMLEEVINEYAKLGYRVIASNLENHYPTVLMERRED